MGNPIEPKNVCGVEPPAPLPTALQTPATPTANSTLSSCKRAEVATRLSKPQLPSPTQKQTGIHKSMADFVNGVERSRQSTIRSDLKRLKKLAVENKEMQKTKTAAIIKHADETIRADSWTYLKDIAFCLSQTTSVLMGGALTASGNPWGGALMASGVTSFVAHAMEKANAASATTGALSLAAAGMGILGGAASFNELGQVVKTVQTAFSLASATTKLGVEETKAQREYLAKELSRIEHALGVAEQDTRKIMNDTKEAAKQIDAASNVSDSMRDYQRVVAQIAGASAA